MHEPCEQSEHKQKKGFKEGQLEEESQKGLPLNWLLKHEIMSSHPVGLFPGCFLYVGQCAQSLPETSSLIPTAPLEASAAILPHCAAEEMQAQRGRATCPRSHSGVV